MDGRNEHDKNVIKHPAGSIPIFCNHSWGQEETTLTGFETLSGLILCNISSKPAEVTKNQGCPPSVMPYEFAG